jgi:hypothetical protein
LLLSVGLVLLAALAVQRAAPQANVAPAAHAPRRLVAATSAGWPGGTLMGSAYSGQ